MRALRGGTARRCERAECECEGECVRAGALPFPRGARGCQLARPGLLPPAPLPRAPVPLLPIALPGPEPRRWDATAGASGSGGSRIGSPRAPPCPRGPSRPSPVRSRQPRFTGPRPVKTFVAAAARAASGAGRRTGGGRSGRRAELPGAGGEGSESGGPGPRPHRTPARRRRRRRLGRRQRRLGRRGSRRRTTSGPTTS